MTEQEFLTTESTEIYKIFSEFSVFCGFASEFFITSLSAFICGFIFAHSVKI